VLSFRELVVCSPESDYDDSDNDDSMIASVKYVQQICVNINNT